MSENIDVTVHLDGQTQTYSIDIATLISDFIKNIVDSHQSLKTSPIQNVDLNICKLIYNNKILDNHKSLEEYTEFQYKSKSSYNMNFIVGFKFGDLKTQPIPIPSNKNNDSIHSTHPINPKPVENEISMSFPSTNNFLYKHLGRIDKRNKSVGLKNVYSSLNDISNWIKDLSEQTDPSDKMDKIIELLQSMHLKMDKLLELNNS